MHKIRQIGKNCSINCGMGENYCKKTLSNLKMYLMLQKHFKFGPVVRQTSVVKLNETTAPMDQT